jgi:hypothetical protein
MDRDEWVDGRTLTDAKNVLFDQRFWDLETNTRASVS